MKTRWIATVCLLLASAASAASAQAREKVLPADRAPVDSPLKAHPEAPQFELSNLRKERSRFLANELTVDFKRTGGKGSAYDVVLVAKSSSGRDVYRSRFFSPFSRSSGTVQCSSGFGLMATRVGANVEVWLEQHTVMGGRQLRMKVSNSITMGDVGRISLAREWKPAEERALADWKKSRTPPPAPPTGFVAVDADTKLLRGMSVRVGWMAKWENGEVIDVRTDGNILVKYATATKHLTIRPRNWICVAEATLERARNKPESFEPSVVVVPNGTTPIAANLRPLPDDLKLTPGVPLRAEWAAKWNPVTVLKITDDNRVRIRWDKWGSSWDATRARSSLLISNETLDALEKPGATEQFAARLKKLDSGKSVASTRRLKSYPITIAVPETAARVDKQTPLRKGVKLSCSWANRWHPVTVLAVYDDGALRIRWDTYGSNWDCDISRKCLIVDKKVLASLQAAGKPKLVRTWTDASGRFKIEATLIGVTEDSVKLRRTDGRDVEVPLAKLSAADREAVATWRKSPAENPFEP